MSETNLKNRDLFISDDQYFAVKIFQILWCFNSSFMFNFTFSILNSSVIFHHSQKLKPFF